MTGQINNIERTPLGQSRNGISVWYDKESSHTATHFADEPKLEALVKEVITSTELDGEFTVFNTDMGRIIGNSDLVEIEPGDEVVYAKRLNRDEYTVFNLSKKPKPSTLVSVGLKKVDETYCLVSAWIGDSDSPSFPGTARETPDSKEYWSKHALAWGTQEIQPDTKTKTCPW